MIPAAWTATPPNYNGEPAPFVFTTTESHTVGTDFPYGCRWCGRSTQRDEVEYCEQLQGVVHSECHELECVVCRELLCTEDRCDYRDECEGCYETVCKRHGVSECDC